MKLKVSFIGTENEEKCHKFVTWSQDNKTFFMLNSTRSTEHEISTDNKN